VDDLAAGLAGRGDDPGSSVAGSEERAAIGRLAAATRVELGGVQRDERSRVPLTGRDRHDPRLDRSQVGVRVAELLAHVPCRYLTVSVPVMAIGWTAQWNGYAPAA